MKKRNQKKNRVFKNVNQTPGYVVYKGDKPNRETKFDLIAYDRETCEEHQNEDLASLLESLDNKKLSWVNINGLSDTKAIQEIGRHFGLHPLILEDVADTLQPPKFDIYENSLLVVLKMLYPQNGGYVKEHISIVVGHDFVLTFQESDHDVFDGIRRRIKNQQGQVRLTKSDYLLYALIDAIIDNYFEAIETFGERIETLENLIISGKMEGDMVQHIQQLKRKIIDLRRIIYPIRDLTGRLEHGETPLITPETGNYYRDLFNHSIQNSENVEIYREMIWSLMDLYMSTVSNRMNEVMKVLTIMASIFIPLTFLAGVYGMNFENMPELHWTYGYFYILGIMVLIILVMLWYFKRKRWL